MTDWSEMEKAMIEFRMATDEIKREVRERISIEMKIAPMWNPATVMDWMLSDETTYASASDWYGAAQKHFPGITTIEFNQVAADVRGRLKGTSK